VASLFASEQSQAPETIRPLAGELGEAVARALVLTPVSLVLPVASCGFLVAEEPLSAASQNV
jgi:hypothetical protein